MLKIPHIVCAIAAIFSLVTSCESEGWRGITPLHSTKNDVVRLLGPAVDTNEVRSIYQLENEEVYIVFSGSQFCNVPGIPKGTVLLIQITPRGNQSLIDLQIDRRTFREFRPSSQDPNWKGLIDEEQGFMVRSYKDKVDEIFYFAAAKDRDRCPDYYAEPESYAQITVDFTSGLFDEYSDLAFSDEKARLDNFAIYLQKEKPTWKGYIVAYNGTNCTTNVRERSDRAKKYLIGLGLDDKRILTIMGGRRDRFTIELYALPSDLPPPIPNPTNY